MRILLVEDEAPLRETLAARLKREGFAVDIAAVFEGANFVLLGITALVVALLLIVTYRSPILWKSLWQLGSTALLFAGCWWATAASLQVHRLAHDACGTTERSQLRF